MLLKLGYRRSSNSSSTSISTYEIAVNQSLLSTSSCYMTTIYLLDMKDKIHWGRHGSL